MTACEYSGRPPDTNSHQPSLRPEQRTARSELATREIPFGYCEEDQGKMISEHKINYQLGLPLPGSPHLK